MDEKEIEKIKEDCEFLFDKVLGILLYGSSVKNERTERSDIDLCVIAPHMNSHTIFKETLPLNYDVRIFEIMPLYLKMELIEHHEVIYARDIFDLYEYFYSFRKLWEDQRHRQRLSKEEALYILS
ncbi:MAG: nucleotidyltransferase domain-containing protein [Euryarchaeota archaeon]|nr:nucleotidyltransferase domain-containing protein [Euryarchaeota archaeon]